MHRMGKIKRNKNFALNPDKGQCNTALFPIYPVQQAAAA